MRIIDNKNHDYYDVGMRWDQSGYPIWKRKENQLTLDSSMFISRHDTFTIVGVAGKTYLYLQGYTDSKGKFVEAWELQDLSKAYTVGHLYNDAVLDVIGDRVYWTRKPLSDTIADKLTQTKVLFEEYKTPIFTAQFYQGEIRLNTAPILKDINFQQILDPFTLYQEIDMWVGTYLTQEVETSVLSDKDKAKKAGFGKKYDFRKKPSKK